MLTLKGHLTATTGLVAVLLAGPAIAQDASGGATQVQEVVVTAQKKSENLQKVPMSVTAIGSTELSSRHITDPSQVAVLAPSLQLTSFNAQSGATNFSVRGVGTTSFADSIDSSVTTVIDGVSMGRPEMAQANFLDVQQIEVLNGPQGMLFGKNASAGLVTITTTAPILGRYSGMASVDYSQVATATPGWSEIYQGIVNIPVGEDQALRVAGSYTHLPALVDNVTADPGSKWDQDEVNLKAKYLWAPTDSLRVTFGADFATVSGVGGGSATDRTLAPNGIYANPQPPASAFTSEDARLGIVPGPDNDLSSYDAPTNLVLHVGGVQSNIVYKFGGGYSLTNIAAYRYFNDVNKFDDDKHDTDILDDFIQTASLSQFTDELRLSSPASHLFDYQVGLYYYRGWTDGTAQILGNEGGPTPPGKTALIGLDAVSHENQTSLAAFGQGTLHVSDALRLVFGGRFTRDTASYSGDDVSADGAEIAAGTLGVGAQGLSYNDFSWRVSGEYDVAKNIMAYATTAVGYKGPGFAGTIPVTPIVRAEIPTMYEVGLKNEFFDKRLIFNVSAYWENFHNFQSQGYDAALNGGTGGYVLLNAGNLASRGAEVQMTAIPVKNLTLTAGLSYVDAYFTSFLKNQCWYGQPVGTGVNECTPSAARDGGTTNSTGDALQDSPRYTVTASANYKHQVTSDLDGFILASVYGRSEVNFTTNANPNTIQGGYALLDLTAGVMPSVGDRWKISVYCRNCMDTRYVVQINANSATHYDYYQQFNLDSFRSVGVSLEGRF